MSDRPFDQNVTGTPTQPVTTPPATPSPGTMPPAPGVPTPLPATPPAGQATQQSTGDVAQQEAASVGHDAQEGAAQVAQTAKDEVQHLAHEATDHVRSLMAQVGDDVSVQARTQQHRAAQGLHGLADEFSHMAEGEQGSSMAVGLVQQASQRLDGVAGWLEGREPADLLEDVKRYARRNPGTFLAVCGLVGLVGGRLTRGLRDDATGGSPQDGFADYGVAGPTAGRTTYQPVADAGVYATTPGVPTAHATRDYPADLATTEEPLPTGEELLTREDGDRL